MSKHGPDPVGREYSAAASRYDEKWAFYVDATTRQTLARMSWLWGLMTAIAAKPQLRP